MRKISDLISSELAFFPELGFGYFPVPKNRPYDADYFGKYLKMADTEMGRQLTKSRVELVRKHHKGDVVDVGIGCGQFVTSCDCMGYDVNPAGIEWLKNKGKWGDLYKEEWDALTMWDSLEHMYEPDKAIAKAKKWVFISIPIFNGAEDILTSKHFRKNEHIFYFTHQGLINWFAIQGFICIEWSKFESELGREGITTYAFKRVS
ncbi:class I SAM-dependent methyltransferase [Phytobacter ursingii]